MNKFKYAAIIAVVAISAVIGTISMKKNSPKTELSGLALANVAALTQSEGGSGSDCTSSRVCPNGGQKSRGEAKSKQWSESFTVNASGDVELGVTKKHIGTEYSGTRIYINVFSVECPGIFGSCCVCNLYLL